MRIRYVMFIINILVIANNITFAQDSVNCFLQDFQPKDAIIPAFDLVDKTALTPTVTVTINSDTLGEISKYIFGNAVAVWVGPNVNNPILMNHLQKLAPTLIRFPGGSWSDIYFWKGDPGDLPINIVDGTTHQKVPLGAQFGSGHSLTVDSYYDLRQQLNAEGLITINYAYARYGLSADPVAQAAHYAADWVRYDDGQTKFWEIGNENGGPWEAGWEIDTTTNKDGQPKIISGELYGKHFKVFADSMKAAAKKLGNTIYIGGLISQDGPSSWNSVDWNWNEGLFKEAGDAVDFYVMHNYFGNTTSTLKAQVDNAISLLNTNMSFIRQNIKSNSAPIRPIALTEWNMSGPDQAKTSIANGLQAVVLINELIKNNFGLSSRWLVANWESDGMFYNGNNSSLPLWNPRPDFYYVDYLQKFTGDHVLGTSVDGSSDILAYASKFGSGHDGVVVVNKGNANQVIKLLPKGGVGEKYYIYSLTGGTDNVQFSQNVYVNGSGPTNAVPWGPLENLDNIKAWAYPIDGEIRFESPKKSVQFIMIEPGNNIITVMKENSELPEKFSLEQNYPNPFNPVTTITYSLPSESSVTLKVYDETGREVSTIINNKKSGPGNYTVSFDAAKLASGVYFYSLYTEKFTQTHKMLLLK